MKRMHGAQSIDCWVNVIAGRKQTQSISSINWIPLTPEWNWLRWNELRHAAANELIHDWKEWRNEVRWPRLRCFKQFISLQSIHCFCCRPAMSQIILIEAKRAPFPTSFIKIDFRCFLKECKRKHFTQSITPSSLRSRNWWWNYFLFNKISWWK